MPECSALSKDRPVWGRPRDSRLRAKTRLGSHLLSPFLKPGFPLRSKVMWMFSAGWRRPRSSSRKASRPHNRILRSEPLELRTLLSANSFCSLLASQVLASRAAMVSTAVPLQRCTDRGASHQHQQQCGRHRQDGFALGSGKRRRGRSQARLQLVGHGLARRRDGHLQRQRHQRGEECDGYVHRGRHLQLDCEDH